MVLKRLDEESVGETSLVLEFFTLSLDLSESSISPLEPFVGLRDLSFNLSSVGLSIEPILFVDVDNLGELRDDSSTSFFISVVLLVSSSLDINVFSLEVS